MYHYNFEFYFGESAKYKINLKDNRNRRFYIDLKTNKAFARIDSKYNDKILTMLINEKTKIAALIKHHPDALEAIITISSDFKKLRNPILRKLMAGRTSIAMASKIGGVTAEDFFEVLKPLGFEWENEEIEEKGIEEVKEVVFPDYIKNAKEGQIIDFDVRPILDGGADPLRDIQAKIKELKEGEILNIINSFEPIPLILLIEKQGFKSFVNTIALDHYETYFYKDGEVEDTTILTSSEDVIRDNASEADWDSLMQRFKGSFVEINIKHLEPPQPMMKILEALEILEPGQALFVNHKRVPVYLITELQEGGYTFRINEVKEGEVYLIIFKDE